MIVSNVPPASTRPFLGGRVFVRIREDRVSEIAERSGATQRRNGGGGQADRALAGNFWSTAALHEGLLMAGVSIGSIQVIQPPIIHPVKGFVRNLF